MPKGANQKIKLLYMVRIFTEETDCNHALSVKELIERLAKNDIELNHRTFYDDLAVLQDMGMDIASCGSGRSTKYYLRSREFALSELRVLADSVAAARFISEQESAELIRKLTTLCSRHESDTLRRNVIVSGRVKTRDESSEILNNVAVVQSAIRNNHMIRFHYCEWTPHKQKVAKHNGREYCMNPIHLAWFEENYYMIAFDQDAAREKHFRIDKMLDVRESQEPRIRSAIISQFDAPGYMRKMFGMYSGEPKTVKLECADFMANVIIDRFGADTFIVPQNDGHFTATVEVVPSKQFLGWVLSLGGNVKIIYPETVIAEMKTLLREQAEVYGL